MDLRNANRRIFSCGVVIAVAFTAGQWEAQAADKKATQTSTQSAPAAKAAPVQTKSNAVRPAGTTNVHPPPGHNPPPPGHNPPPPGHNPPPPGSGPMKYQPPADVQGTKLSNGLTQYAGPRPNSFVTTDRSGHVRSIEAPLGMAGANKMTINRGPAGRVVTTGHPGARVVSYGPKRGFVERPLGRPGYMSRTYMYGGHPYARVYREYRYGEYHYYRYVPAYYYGPAYYGWAAGPWGAPVAYSWGGPVAAPWLGFYAGYFTPYATYASANLWLTDYLIAQNLNLAYQNQQDANQDAKEGQSGPPQQSGQAAALSPEVKAQIAEEVRQQLAAERAAASQPTSFSDQQPASATEQPPPALSQKFFVVSSNLDVTVAGQACSLTPGDIIERRSKEVAAGGGVAVEVVSSKPGDCAAEAATTVALDQLQDMHNQFQEQIDSGLKMLAENKALPKGPAATPRAVPAGIADPAPNAEAQLVAQQTDATNLEAQVRQSGGGS